MVLIFCKKRFYESHTLTGFTTFCLAYKVHTDCADIAFCICVIGESQQQAGLSNARISNQQQFKEIIAVE